jgi:hypothetical protein
MHGTLPLYLRQFDADAPRCATNNFDRPYDGLLIAPVMLRSLNHCPTVLYAGVMVYSSSFLTDASSAPQSRQPGFTLIDGSIRLGDVNDRWEALFIGRNVSNKHYWVASPNVPFKGNTPPAVPAVLGDPFASVSRGRELLMEVSYKFGK